MSVSTRKLILAAVIFLAVMSPALAFARTDPAASSRPASFGPTAAIPPDLGRAQGRVRVVVALAGDPIADRAQGALRSRLQSHLTRGQQLTASRAATALVAAKERDRESALSRLQFGADRVATQQTDLALAIRAEGGTIERQLLLGNAVVAALPATALDRIAARSDVRSISRAPRVQDHSLEVSSAAVGAPAFWGAGFLGGGGPNDTTPADYAIYSDKLQQDHPLFGGITFQTAPNVGTGTACGSAPSPSCDHGTAIASLAIARGTAGFPNERGVAFDPDSVLDADGRTPCGQGMDDLAWSLGFAITYDCNSTFPVVSGAADPAETGSFSFGNFDGQEDSESLRITDTAATLGLALTASAGNDGPAAAASSPCIAFNVICAAGFDTAATATGADDSIWPSSSRGPTPGGRKKPDLAGVATPGSYANRRWFVAGQPLFESGTEGTSFAAAQVAAAWTSLVGSGVTEPMAGKAVLINSARDGRATEAQAIGTQRGWNERWGWGAIDLTRALQERTNYATGTVAPGRPQFYGTSLQSAPHRATLVWLRRPHQGPCPIGPGCAPTGTHTLTNLDLDRVASASGTVEASSVSAIDNVEQVRTDSGPFPRLSVLAVRASSTVDGLDAEPFALASSTPLDALDSPTPSATLTVTPAEARQGQDVAVTATVVNPSADLAAEQTTATLTLPPDVALAPGSPPATQSIGTLSESGTAGDAQDVTWTVRATGDGSHQLAVGVTAVKYGTPLAGDSDTAALAVDSTPPTINIISAPSGTTTATVAHVAWHGSDAGSGIGTYDLERQALPGPFVPILQGTPTTSADVPTPAGSTYSFRVRAFDRAGNESDYISTPPLTVLAPVVIPPPPDWPPRPSKTSPRLRIVRAAKAGSKLTVTGTVARGVARRLRVTYLPRRRATARRTVMPKRGRFRVVLKLRRAAASAKRGRIVVKYGGDALRRAQRVSRRVQFTGRRARLTS